MSMFGLGRPQPSSQEKIAAAEAEMDLMTDMFNKYVLDSLSFPADLLSSPISNSPDSPTTALNLIYPFSCALYIVLIAMADFNKHASESASQIPIAKARSTKARESVSTGVRRNFLMSS
jgi:hypothetical protein